MRLNRLLYLKCGMFANVLHISPHFSCLFFDIIIVVLA